MCALGPAVSLALARRGTTLSTVHDSPSIAALSFSGIDRGPCLNHLQKRGGAGRVGATLKSPAGPAPLRAKFWHHSPRVPAGADETTTKSLRGVTDFSGVKNAPFRVVARGWDTDGQGGGGKTEAAGRGGAGSVRSPVKTPVAASTSSTCFGCSSSSRVSVWVSPPHQVVSQPWAQSLQSCYARNRFQFIVLIPLSEH